MPKAKKKKRRNRNKDKQAQESAANPAEGAEEEEGGVLPAVAHTASQEALPDIFGGSGNKDAGQINEILSPHGGPVNPDLEISDGEAPDAEEAKRNLRSQAEKKRKHKTTVVGGVTRDVDVEVADQS